jgi:hypothetical protein
MKMPKRNQSKSLTSYSKPKITPKMKQKAKSLGKKKKVKMSPMNKGKKY